MSVQPYDLAFFAAGTPVPKGSTKPRPVRNRQGRIVSVGVTGDNQERQDRWSGFVAQAAREAHLWDQVPAGERDPWGGEVECVTHFVVPLLPDGGKTLRESATQRSVGDGDKLTRCVWDALTGIVWVDDSQVTQWGGSKRLAAPGEQPGVQVYVRLLDMR